MAFLNAALRRVFDLLLAPASAWPPIVPIAVVSLLVGIGMLMVFKRMSDQARLAHVKRLITAGIFEIRLFNDDLVAILRAQADILRHNLSYLRLTLWPSLFILPPLVLVMAQLQFHYGYEGLRPGQKTLLRVDLAPEAVPAGQRPEVRLDVPAGLRADTEAIWLPAESQVAWRLVAESDGDYQLGVAVGGGPPVEKSVRVTSRAVRLAPERVDSGFLSQLLYPAEPPLPEKSPIRAIRLTYPDREVSVLGFGMYWMIPFFVLSLLFAFSLKGFFKVTI
jgi:hypothetical protein